MCNLTLCAVAFGLSAVATLAETATEKDKREVLKFVRETPAPELPAAALNSLRQKSVNDRRTFAEHLIDAVAQERPGALGPVVSAIAARHPETAPPLIQRAAKLSPSQRVDLETIASRSQRSQIPSHAQIAKPGAELRSAAKASATPARPPANRPAITPGNSNGNRPTLPPGHVRDPKPGRERQGPKNYARP